MFWLVGLLLAGMLLCLPFVHLQLAALPAFVGVSDAALFVVDLITAALLYAQFFISRSRALLALAVGYLLSAFLTVPHALTYPGALLPEAALGATLQSPVWLYVFIHFALPVATLCYASLKRGADMIPAAEPLSRPFVASIGISACVALALTWLATAGVGLLPPIMADELHAGRGWPDVLALLALGVIGTALVVVWRRRTSVLDLWIIVMLAASFIETSFLFLARTRYSVMWYMGRAYVVMASSFVMIMLMAEATRLYARVAIAAAARDREKEHKQMSLGLVVDAMAHELNQPLCAIVANGDAADEFLAHDPPNVAEARAALADIAADGERASLVIASTRALLTGTPADATPVDVRALVTEALLLMRMELRSFEVAPDVQAPDDLPPVRGNRSQLLQLLVNLLTNSLESLSGVNDRARELRIRASGIAPGSVTISIEDSGEGIAPEHAPRVFEPFFTTKPNRAGLGLALCRMIVESHGGEISMSRGRPFGSAFHVVLPAPGGDRP